MTKNNRKSIARADRNEYDRVKASGKNDRDIVSPRVTSDRKNSMRDRDIVTPLGYKRDMVTPNFTRENTATPSFHRDIVTPSFTRENNTNGYSRQASENYTNYLTLYTTK